MTRLSVEKQCETGCMIYTGGERRHHRDCVFYPQSMSAEIDALRAENEKLKTNQVFEASCTQLFEDNQNLLSTICQLKESEGELKAENVNLKATLYNRTEILNKYREKDRVYRERVKELREALIEWLAATPTDGNGKYNPIKEPQACKALDTLARDAAYEKANG